jgi:hypothetical protein
VPFCFRSHDLNLDRSMELNINRNYGILGNEDFGKQDVLGILKRGDGLSFNCMLFLRMRPVCL